MKKGEAVIELRFKDEEAANKFITAWFEVGEQECGFDTSYDKSDTWTKGIPGWLYLEDDEELG